MKISSKKLEKVAVKFTGLMITKIREIEKDWQKPWLPIKRMNFYPRNFSGRHYSGGNTIMLLLRSLMLDFRTPVFLTFKQANDMGVRVKRQATSFPVYHFSYMYFNSKTNERITAKKYEELEEFEKKDYFPFVTPRYYDVFNLDQTDYSEKYPEEWSELLSNHEIIPDLYSTGTYSNSLLDSLINNQTWVCPIQTRLSNRAYYSPSQDHIVLPLKSQFNYAQSFYSTALHEITHSTGMEDRLNRIKPGHIKGTPQYAKEELVAELTAALMCFYIGIESAIQEDNASYLKHWISELDKDPDYLMDVLSDVVKAVKFICLKMDFNPFEKDVTEVATVKKEPVLAEELVIVE